MGKKMLNKIPMALVYLRILLAPFVIVMYLIGVNSAAYFFVLVAALFSDIFDGVLARKLGVATERLRAMDSLADTGFYLTIALVACLQYPEAIASFAVPISILVGLELARYIVDWHKFSKSAAYHMWSAKLWGIFLFLGFCQLLGFGQAGLFFELAIYIGIATNIEGLLASFILPKWRCDVPSLLHAFGLRMQDSFAAYE
jgi:CDP-diacylglycerol--glycerol-3-phosphate 3-phosphatidyltransferase